MPRKNKPPLAPQHPLNVETLIREYGMRLYRTALTLCHDEELARDTVQQALLIALERRNQFRGDAHPLTWLYSIMFHECVRFQRNSLKFTPLPPEVIFSKKRSREWEDLFSQEDQLIGKEKIKEMKEAIKDLPLNIRIPLILYEWEDLSHEEIARILKTTPGNIKVRLHRARKALKERLKKDQVGS